MTTHHIGTPYKQFQTRESFDAIVIGSGIGGLGTAAALAKAAGQRVLVLERHHSAGGFMHTFHRPGFEWDVGVHYLGQVHHAGSPTAALFEYLTEGRLSWNPMPDVYDRVLIGGQRFDYVTGTARLRDALVEAFPAEHSAIDRYFQAIARCLRVLPAFYGEKAMPPLLAGPLGGLLRAPFLKSARRTTGEVLDELGMSRDLKAVLTAQWGDYGLPPGRSSFAIHAIVTAHYFDGGAYPVGGASAIVRAIVPTIERAGGAVVVAADVERILVSGGQAVGVRMADGREFRAAAVISDAGARTTFGRLLPEPSAAVERLRQDIQAIGPSTAHLGLYVGLSGDRLTAPLKGSNLWIHPSADFDRNWSAFCADADAPFPLLFVSFPSAKDPTFQQRYPGHHTIEVVVPAPYDLFARWGGSAWQRRAESYDALKAHLEARLLAELRRYLPGIGRAVERCELSTPLSTQHFANASRGEIYGLAHNPERFDCRGLRPATPIGNLYLTGADVSTCGVAGALAGAMTTASVMLRRSMFSVAARAGRTPPVNRLVRSAA